MKPQMPRRPIFLISRAEGAVSAKSWQALPYEQFLEPLQSVQGKR